MNARLRNVLTTIAIVVVVILLVGATYQGVATALDRRNFPRPGGLVSVGDHQLHIYCTGASQSDRPTVVLEAPEGSMSSEWAWVQAALTERGRVCSYDRSGLGWSEAGDQPYDPGRVPDELHTLLHNASVPGPYVLVGQSLGAAFARLYAARYAQELSAAVLIDMPDASGRPDDVSLVAMSPWLARAGVLRASGLFADRADGLPEKDAGALRSFMNRPDHLTRASRELSRWDDAVRLAADARGPRGVEVVTLSFAPERITDRDHARRIVAAIHDLK